IKRGDVLSFRLSGAGGYGPPDKRDPAAIAQDIADGYVTRDAARRDYGEGRVPREWALSQTANRANRAARKDHVARVSNETAPELAYFSLRLANWMVRRFG